MGVESGIHIDLSAFVGLFCVPIVCSKADVTLSTMVERVTAISAVSGCLSAKRTAGQWVALIFFSAITFGGIWVAAYIAVKYGESDSIISALYTFATHDVAGEMSTKSDDELAKFFFRSKVDGHVPNGELFTELADSIGHLASFSFDKDGTNLMLKLNGAVLPGSETEFECTDIFTGLLRELHSKGGSDKLVPTEKDPAVHSPEHYALAAALRRHFTLNFCKKATRAVLDSMVWRLKQASPSAFVAFQESIRDSARAEISGAADMLSSRMAAHDADIINFIEAIVTGVAASWQFRDALGINVAIARSVTAGDESAKEGIRSVEDLIDNELLKLLRKNVLGHRTPKDAHAGLRSAGDELFQAFRNHIHKTTAQHIAEWPIVIKNQDKQTSMHLDEYVSSVYEKDDKFRAYVEKFRRAAVELHRVKNYLYPAKLTQTVVARPKATSTFRRIFVLPLSHCISGGDGEKLSPGDVAMLIAASILTLGTVWMVAFFSDASQYIDNGVAKPFSRPDLSSSELDQIPVVDEAGAQELTAHFFALENKAAAPKEIFNHVRNLLLLKINASPFFFGSDGHFHNADNILAGKDDGRSGDEIFEDILAAFDVPNSMLSLNSGIDLTGEDREKWNMLMRFTLGSCKDEIASTRSLRRNSSSMS